MTLLSFTEFFRELNGNSDPFPWQNDLAERAVAGDWPDFIAAPTGSGKTACLEVAVYALAAQAHLPPPERSASRRIFFIVNRRVIVDEAFDRARRMARSLAAPFPDRPACQAVAEALLSLNPLPPGATGFPRIPLDCVQLRGAIYRDQRWTRSLLQPTLVATTVDQVGSRMLLRGYGVTTNARPIHAALVATDALWILDEAHISRPFAQTVATLQRYREHHLSNQPSAIHPPPLRWVQMTATPPKTGGRILDLTQADREHPVLAKRLDAAKPTRLVVSEPKNKAKHQDALVTKLIDQAAKVIDEDTPWSLAIMVNRVATARLVAEKLTREVTSKNARFCARVSLLIGRMRPLDRDTETERIQLALKSAARREPPPEGEPPPPVEIVVATQCLEVGADLDFDALITECASLDALRQRFGRLNRTGRDIPASSAIIIPDHLIEPDRKKLDKFTAENSPLDPIYGNALSATWNWLQSVASEDTVDFSLTSMGALVEKLSETEGELDRLQTPTSAAPALFPAYLEAWAQTNPIPWPDPDPAVFLHGKQSARPDVLVLWRSELQENPKLENAVHDISLCPPSQVEALPVPLPVFRDWLFQANAKNADASDTGDLLDSAAAPDTHKGRNEQNPIGRALLWQGAAESRWIDRPGDLSPGATVVLPLHLGGWSRLGHIPDAPPDPATLKDKEEAPSTEELRRIDRAEEAFRITRDRGLLRLHPKHFSTDSGGAAWQSLLEYAGNAEKTLTQPELASAIEEAANDDSLPEPLRDTLSRFATHGFTEARYADEAGIILTTRGRLGENKTLAQAEDEAEEWSRSTTHPVTLRTHTRHVRELAIATARALGLSEEMQTCITIAAELHDWGKLDPRFQALLLGGNPHAAYALAEPLAKSERIFTSARDFKRARERAALPAGFRHELASLQIAAHPGAARLLTENTDTRDLALHLITSHHGYARPFAPVGEDAEPPPLETEALSESTAISVNQDERKNHPAHRLDSGVAERFWKLLRQHGPWGLAFLESILRLADQQASEAEAEGWYAEATEVDLESASQQ